MRLCAGLAVVVTFVVAVAVLAPSAGASIYCVPNLAACPSGVTGTAIADLTTAMSTNSSDFADDTIYLGSGVQTTTGGGFSATGFDHLLVVGAGKAQTTLTSNAATSNTYVFDMANNNRPITMKNLTIAIPASFPANSSYGVRLLGNVQGPDVLDGVDIENLNAGSTGIFGINGVGSFLNGRIYGTAPIRAGIEDEPTDTGAVTIDHASIEGPDLGIYQQSQNNPFTVSHSVLAGGSEAAVTSNRGAVTVRNSVIRTVGETALHSWATVAADALITADHDTLVNTSGSAPPVSAEVTPGTTGNASLAVTNSIMWGYDQAYARSAPVSPTLGNASLSISHSNFPTAGPVEAGDGTTTLGAGNINSDPLFVSAGDLSLGTGSPSIDAGDPADTTTDDFVGATRPLDGNGDGLAVSDQGAYEHPAIPVTPPPADTTPPGTRKGKGPKARITAHRATFRFSSSEGGSSFECRLDRKAFAGCRSPKTYKGLRLGKHRVSVRAIDSVGNVDPTPVKFAFRVVEKHRRHG